jgi:hypothetical protein
MVYVLRLPMNHSKSRQMTAARKSLRAGHLNIYYDAVTACIRDAESILIFGPGEAKGELQKRIEKTQWTHRR